MAPTATPTSCSSSSSSSSRSPLPAAQQRPSSSGRPQRRSGRLRHAPCSSSLLLPLLLLAVALAPAPGADAAAAQQQQRGRRLLIRPMPSGAGTCRNSYQGPLLMADDKGRVCSTAELDFYTGCCKAGETHTCSKCNALDSCCESFEHCVSCCMDPANKPDARRKEAPRWSPRASDSAVWGDAFEYCMATCRSHKGSTSHENSYIGPRHHCFSKLGKPMMSPPLPAGALDGVLVVMSAAGASCDTVCGEQGARCSAAHLPTLNSCDRLREVLNCEAGCMEEAHEGFMPASVDAEAPKGSRPALCLVSKAPAAAGAAAASKDAFSCDASANYMRRLCPCLKGDGSAAAAAAGSTSLSSSSSSSAKRAGGSGSPSKASGTRGEPEAATPDASAGPAAGGAAAAAAAERARPEADGIGGAGGAEQQVGGAGATDKRHRA